MAAASVNIPRIWQDDDVMGSALLEDVRLDRLLEQAALSWASINACLGIDRAPDDEQMFAASYFREGATLHLRRGLKNLRAGKELPSKATPAQVNNHLRDEDLPQLNNILMAILGQFVLDVAGALGDCAVMFSDPAAVAKRMEF